MIEWILIILLYAIGIPIEIKEMKNDFSFFILRIVSILLTSSNVIIFQTFLFHYYKPDTKSINPSKGLKANCCVDINFQLIIRIKQIPSYLYASSPYNYLIVNHGSGRRLLTFFVKS